MSANERVNFGSEVGENGGAAFILVYILCVMFLGIPVMVSEFLIGRRSRANTGGAYEVLAPGTHWKWVGMMGVVAAFLILGYYGVVAGWHRLRGDFPGARTIRFSSMTLSAVLGNLYSIWRLLSC